MTPSDEAIIDAILKAEGGFVNDGADRGHATNWGIAQATLSAWLGREATVQDVRDLPVATARAIYAQKYVQPFDGVDPALKPHVVDIAVNSGVSRARAMLTAAQGQSQRPAAVQLVVERLRHYARIVRSDPTQVKFLVGWVERTCRFI